MNADELQRTLDSIPGFFPGDIKIEQPRSLAQDLEDLYSDPEVSGIRVQDWHSGSEPVEVEQCPILKESANQAFKAKNYRKAVDLYTKALKAANSTTSVELKRTILANRAQCYINLDDNYGGLQDANLALSPLFTRLDSPKGLTAKCLFRSAKALCLLKRYSEARSKYEELVILRRALGAEMTAEELSLEKTIDQGMLAMDID